MNLILHNPNSRYTAYSVVFPSPFAAGIAGICLLMMFSTGIAAQSHIQDQRPAASIMPVMQAQSTLSQSLTVTQAPTPHFDRLRNRIEAGEIFRAGFSHEYQDSYTGEHTETEGDIWIGSERYRVESDGQVMVVDQEISRVYDSFRNRLLISEYDEEEDDFAPSRMLQGVDETYEVLEDERSSEIRITLTSDDPFAIFTRVEITLDPEGKPVEIQAVDQVENLLITLFQEGQFMEADPDLFEMDIPEDAERIDLRH